MGVHPEIIHFDGIFHEIIHFGVPPAIEPLHISISIATPDLHPIPIRSLRLHRRGVLSACDFGV